MAYQSVTSFGGFSFGDRIAALRSELAARYANYKVYKTTLNELSNLDNRDLSDLGLNRSMIKSVALEAAYGN